MSKKFFKNVPNLVHYLPVFADEDRNVHALVEINAMTINKYEIDTVGGFLKLDRVGLSTLSYPFTYGEIPQTLDQDNDPLDIMIVGVREPLAPGCVAVCKVIGVIKFTDGGEVDDKIIAVLADDKRMKEVEDISYFGEHFLKEVEYFWNHYKDLKKPGTCLVEGVFDSKKAFQILDECSKRYQTEILPFIE